MCLFSFVRDWLAAQPRDSGVETVISQDECFQNDAFRDWPFNWAGRRIGTALNFAHPDYTPPLVKSNRTRHMTCGLWPEQKMATAMIDESPREQETGGSALLQTLADTQDPRVSKTQILRVLAPLADQ